MIRIRNKVSMGNWAIDVYGLHAASRQFVLHRLEDTDRLHVSPLTWQPPGYSEDQRRAGSGPSRTVDDTIGSLRSMTSQSNYARKADAVFNRSVQHLHQRGILVIAEDHECDPRHVAEVETSWYEAGLMGRPTNETISAVITADSLSMDLITDDADARKLATHWNVRPVTVAQFAYALAA